MKNIKNQVLVIFGASGDLTYRKLIPAIFDLYLQKTLPKNFAVLGVARSEFSDQSFRDKMKDGLKQFSTRNAEESTIDEFIKLVHYQSIETDNGDDYVKVKDRLITIDQEYGTDGNYIFYLSTPPALYPLIPGYLAKHGLNKEKNKIRRVVVEKPFGTDLESALALNETLLKDYSEDQIFRMDHYLGKETAQNILVTRFGNVIYEPLWNRNFIEHIEITAAESIGVENRGGYYDHSGAMRDMVQNHLLQLVSLIAMEPPTVIESNAIRNEQLKIFQAIRPMTEDRLFKDVIRGQYLASTVKGKYMKGYREEKGVDTESRTETFVALKMFIDNWRWKGVPFYLRTGKRLPTRVSEIVITFKTTPLDLFHQDKHGSTTGNQLILRIHPDEGILLKTGMKVPGNGYEVKSVNMDFHYSELNDHYFPSAYERLILDCMSGDNMLYMQGEAVEETWKFVQPILDYWENDPEAPLHGYPSGSWGPDVADGLIEGEENTWRYPCKNLAEDGVYCEL